MDYILCFIIWFLTVFARFSRFLARLGIGFYEEWEPGKPIKILLVGYNGARNTGSDVRVMEIAKQLKKQFGSEKIRISVLTLDTGALKGYFDEDVTLLRFSSLFPLDLYRACSSHHAAILCEGSTLKSTFANALTLFLCEAAGIMGAQRKPCIAYGAEVGRMDPFLRKAALRFCRDTWFIARTEESFAALQKLGLNGHTGTDAAWFYDPGVPDKITTKLLMDQGWDGKKKLLGIAVINPFCWPVRASLSRWICGMIKGNLSGQYDKWYFFSDSPRRRRLYQRYIRGMAAGVRAFLRSQVTDYAAHNSENKYFPVLIGMERLDKKACRDLRAWLRVPCAMFPAGEYNADVMVGILRRMSLLLTSRYHAAVLSMETGCPIVAVSMDERLDNLMRDLSLDSCLFHPADRQLKSSVFAALCKAQDNQTQIHESLQQQLINYKQSLSEMEIFLKHYIEKSLLTR